MWTMPRIQKRKKKEAAAAAATRVFLDVKSVMYNGCYMCLLLLLSSAPALAFLFPTRRRPPPPPRRTTQFFYPPHHAAQTVATTTTTTTPTPTTTTTALQQARRLSHAMLQVPSVPDTVDYWTTHHQGTVIRSSKDDDSGALKGAFVVLGEPVDDDDDDDSTPTTTLEPFALELMTFRGKKKWQLGTPPSISYIGVSLLATTPPPPGGTPSSSSLSSSAPDHDPNGIPVRKVASAPGDFLARFCLRCSPSSSLDEMQDFYTNVLGMTVKAVDETQLCLRFESSNNDSKDDVPALQASAGGGVQTTLVFEVNDISNDNNDDDDDAESTTSTMSSKDQCFDHLAIQVDDIDQEYKRIKEGDCPRLCMELTEMFGSKLFGVLDPSGYKVFLFGQ